MQLHPHDIWCRSESVLIILSLLLLQMLMSMQALYSEMTSLKDNFHRVLSCERGEVFTNCIMCSWCCAPSILFLQRNYVLLRLCMFPLGFSIYVTDEYASLVCASSHTAQWLGLNLAGFHGKAIYEVNFICLCVSCLRFETCDIHALSTRKTKCDYRERLITLFDRFWHQNSNPYIVQEPVCVYWHNTQYL